MATILKNGNVCDFSKNEKLDLKLENGNITEISKSIQTKDNDAVIDCEGLHILPSMIDLNVAPKGEKLSKDSILNLNSKAILGGVGTMLLSPSPTHQDELIIEMLKNEYQTTMFVGIKSTADKIPDISISKSNGAVAIFFDSCISGNVANILFEYSKMLDMPCICNPIDESFSNGVVSNGELGYKMGLPTLPSIAQIKEVAKICEVAEFFESKTMFSLICEPRAIDLIDQQKNSYSEVSIHHLALDESAIEGYNTSAKVNPPLKNNDIRKVLLQMLKDKKIDMLTSSHRDFSSNQKNQVFELASPGISCLDSYFSLCYTLLVKNKIIDLSELSLITSYNQAKFLGIKDIGSIEIGNKSKLIVVDLEKKSTPPAPYETIIEDVYAKVCYTINEEKILKVN